MLFQVTVIMTMGGLILCMDMGMAMDMRMLMGMTQLTMGMLMCVNVRMLVSMLQGDGILNHKNRGDNHDPKTDIETYIRYLAKHYDSE